MGHRVGATRFASMGAIYQRSLVESKIVGCKPRGESCPQRFLGRSSGVPRESWAFPWIPWGSLGVRRGDLPDVTPVLQYNMGWRVTEGTECIVGPCWASAFLSPHCIPSASLGQCIVTCPLGLAPGGTVVPSALHLGLAPGGPRFWAPDPGPQALGPRPRAPGPGPRALGSGPWAP